jgi:diamine N-acetyltransferase
MTIFKTASSDDVAEIQKLAEIIWHECYPGIISLEQIDYMLKKMYSAEVINAEIQQGITWELINNGKNNIGIISCCPETVKSTLKISKLYLLAEAYGKGHGQDALEHAKIMASERELHNVYLTVNKNNKRAIAAYNKAGFAQTEAVVAEIGNGFVMDDYIMSCFID